MLLLAIVVAVMVVLVLQGGSLRNLGSLQFRWPALAFLALALQLVIFPPAGTPAWPSLTPALYVVSMGLIGLWAWLNRRIPGVLLFGAGLLCNLLAIAANGGYMPVDPRVASLAGIDRSASNLVIINNSIAVQGSARLWILTDIIPVPAPSPFGNVFSVGDVLLVSGLCWCLARTLRSRKAGDVGMPANT
jgi:hypothetical protein